MSDWQLSKLLRCTYVGFRCSAASTRCRSHHSLCNSAHFHKRRLISTKKSLLIPLVFRAIKSIFQFNGGAILQKERVDKSHGEPEAELARAPGKELPGEPEAGPAREPGKELWMRIGNEVRKRTGNGNRKSTGDETRKGIGEEARKGIRNETHAALRRLDAADGTRKLLQRMECRGTRNASSARRSRITLRLRVVVTWAPNQVFEKSDS